MRKEAIPPPPTHDELVDALCLLADASFRIAKDSEVLSSMYAPERAAILRFLAAENRFTPSINRGNQVIGLLKRP
jgi:hypothetical protein